MTLLLTPRFWPRDRQFWSLHAGGMALIMVTQTLSAWMWGNSVFNDAVATLIWVLPYTLSVLLFRMQFIKHGWVDKRLGVLSLLSLGYGTLAGMGISVIVFLVSMPLSWPDIAKLHAHEPNWRPWLLATKIVVGNGLSNQLFVCAWIFIFISAVAKVRAREVEVANLRLQNHLKEARLSTLASQLNPHFLFNALNNLRFLIREDGRNAEQMVTELSELLRYSLSSNKRDTVALAEEFATVERYLAVMRIQMEDRLTVELDIPASLRSVAVPPMSLQLLVENAIKHGLEPLPTGGLLKVSARDLGDNCVLEVINDKPVQKSDRTEGVRIGLENIRRRLALLFGTHAILSVSDQGTQFVVQISIPRESIC